MDRNKLDAFKEKTQQIKEKAIETGSRVSIKVTFAAKEAGSRLSMTAKEAGRMSLRASRRMSLGGRSKSYMLEDSKHHRDHIENSASTRGSLTKDGMRLDDEADHFDNDNVRVPSDVEEKEEETSRENDQSPPPIIPERPVQTEIPAPRKPSFQVVETNGPPKFRPVKKEGNWNPDSISSARLHQAMLDHKWDEAMWMINQRVDIRKWRGVLGESTLHEACMRRAPSPVIRALIQVGADVNATTLTGLTPLHSACMYSPSATVIELLLTSGSAVNHRTKKGTTPLIAAAMQGRAVEILALLLKHGANPMLSDTNGKRAIDFVDEKRPEAVNLLQNILPFLTFVNIKTDPKLTREVLCRVKSFLY